MFAKGWAKGWRHEKLFWGTLVFGCKVVAAESWSKARTLTDIPARHLGLHWVQVGQLKWFLFYLHAFSSLYFNEMFCRWKWDFCFSRRASRRLWILFCDLHHWWQLAEWLESPFFPCSAPSSLHFHQSVSFLPIILTSLEQPLPCSRWKADIFQKKLFNVYSTHWPHRNGHKTS